MVNAYCEDCEWVATADDTSRQELNRAMIDHFVETGHSLVADWEIDSGAHRDEDEPPLRID